MLSAHSLLASAVRTSLRQAALLTRAPLVFLMAVGALHAQTPNPVLYLKFDEGTGTTAAWVKLNSLGAYQTFVSEDANFQSAFFLQKRGDSQQFSFTVPYDFFTLPQSGFTPVTITWYHLAGVYDAAAQSASLYVNGVLTDPIYNVVSSPANGHTGIGHGRFNNTYVDWVNGAIDDVLLFQAALTAPDVLKLARLAIPL
jgi:concanavalin A-like lectin/glucanase superfamily protein